MSLGTLPLHDANRLGLNYRLEAARLPWPAHPTARPITDAHVHIAGLEQARVFFETADLFGIGRVWSQSPLEQIDDLRHAFGDRFEFVAVPHYAARDRDETFTTDWLRRIEAYHAKGARIAKIWAAPRGRDFHPSFRLDHPTRLEVMRLARNLGMMIMVHVADPDTWFATHYRDSRKYGTKAQQYEPLERLLEQFPQVPWLAAHMAGDPEHLDHLQTLLDRYPHLYLDTSATKWMVRELSKQPQAFRSFVAANPGRVLWGTDIVVNAEQPPDAVFELYASRFWAMRTLMETDYDGPSPIVDPDLSLLDPSLPRESTARLRGAALPPALLEMIYQRAAENLRQRLHGA